MYVIQSKGEGYPIILGRPWLIAMNADQKWGAGTLVLKPETERGVCSQRVTYDMKSGKELDICYETIMDKETSTYSTTESEEETPSEEESSSFDAMGLIFCTEEGSQKEPLSEEVSEECEERFCKIIAKDLTEEEEREYLTMLKKYPNLFITDYSQIIGVTAIEHRIELVPRTKPVAQKLRRMGVVQRDALLAEVNKLLQARFIYPVENLEWVSPVVVTPKKNGKWRICVDYKPLNAATKRDHFPLPFQDEILNEVAGYERYTVCDGYSGYFQIRIAKEDQKKTTFITPWGCFAYRVMPFGLTNAPATFTRFITLVFQPFFGSSIRVFLDDFCIYSRREVHCLEVEKGLQRLHTLGGQLNPDKCHIAQQKVALLGHVILLQGIEVDPGKVTSLVSLPPPTSARQLVTFLQKVRYLSHFIHLLAQMVSALQKLAHATQFVWTAEHQQDFEEVKRVLSTLPIIKSPQWDQTFYVCPSVGAEALGAVLLQKDLDTSFMRPVYFSSKIMGKAEKGYTEVEQMMFALILAVRKFRSYLLTRPFVVLTVNQWFPFVVQHMHLSTRISKWVLELQEYDYSFTVEESTRASLADVLTYRHRKKRITPGEKLKEVKEDPPPPPIEDAFTLFFDGAYRRKTGMAGGGVLLKDPADVNILQQGRIL